MLLRRCWRPPLFLLLQQDNDNYFPIMWITMEREKRGSSSGSNSSACFLALVASALASISTLVIIIYASHSVRRRRGIKAAAALAHHNIAVCSSLWWGHLYWIRHTYVCTFLRRSKRQKHPSRSICVKGGGGLRYCVWCHDMYLGKTDPALSNLL